MSVYYDYIQHKIFKVIDRRPTGNRDDGPMTPFLPMRYDMSMSQKSSYTIIQKS